MFERFTDRARRVLVVAQDEARELGHHNIGPEHLLLGMLNTDGVARRALEDFGVTHDSTRQRVLAATPAGPALAGERLPFTPAAKKVLELSLREALRLGHNYIGTEHLLLGLLRNYEQMNVDVLLVNLGGLRARVVQYATGSPGERAVRSPAMSAAFGRAQATAGDEPMTTGHVLVALSGDPGSQAARALETLGLTERAISEAVASVPLDDTTDASGPPRWFEIRLGGQTATVHDPELAKLLSEVTPEQWREMLRKNLSAEGAEGQEGSP